MAREPRPGETVSGWQGSHPTARQRMVREPSHGEIASGWRGAISWRDSERSAADSEGVLSQRYRECLADREDSCAHKRQLEVEWRILGLTSDELCGGKQQSVRSVWTRTQ